MQQKDRGPPQPPDCVVAGISRPPIIPKPAPVSRGICGLCGTSVMTNQTRKRDRNGTYYHDPCPAAKTAPSVLDAKHDGDSIYGGNGDGVVRGGNHRNKDDGGGDGGVAHQKDHIWKGSIGSLKRRSETKAKGSRRQNGMGASLAKSTLLWEGPTAAEKAAARKQAKSQRRKQNSTDSEKRSAQSREGSASNNTAPKQKGKEKQKLKQKESQREAPADAQNTANTRTPVAALAPAPAPAPASPSRRLWSPASSPPRRAHLSPQPYRSSSTISASSPFSTFPSSAATIDELPDELLLHVFVLVTKPELAALACVCSRFRQIAYDERLWRHINATGITLTSDTLNFFGGR